MSDLIKVYSSAEMLSVLEARREGPLALYITSLASRRSRESLLSVLGQVARVLATLDGVRPEDRAQVSAISYDWGAPGALSYVRVRKALEIVGGRVMIDGQERIRHPALVALARAALRGLAREAFTLGLLSAEERRRIDDVRGPKLRRSLRGRALDDSERAALYAACANDSTALGRRDAALIALLLGAGLRRFEASALLPADCQVGPETLIVTVRHGKGDKPERVPAPLDVAFALEDYLGVRGPEPGPLFCRGWANRALAPGLRLSPAGIYKILLGRAEEADIKKTMPHDLRRTMITDLIDRTGDLALAQRQARHASPATTVRYDMRQEKALVRAIAATTTGYRR